MKIAVFYRRLCEATRKPGLIRSVAVLVSGSVLGQAIVILGSPLLTRLYSPEEFGVFASFGGMLVVIGTMSALGYHVAIPIPKDDREAGELAAVATWLCCMIASVVLGLMFLSNVRQTIFWALGGTFVDYLLLLPLALSLSGFYDICRLWSIRQKKFPILSVVEVSQRLTTLAVQVVLGLAGFAAGGLIAGTLGGLGVSLLALLLCNFKGTRKLPLGIVSISRMLFLIKKFRQFALYRCPSGLVFWGGRCAPLLLLPWLFGPVATGLYALTDRVLQTPMAFVVTHIQSVFLSSCTELKASGKLADATSSLLRTQIWLGLPAFTIFAIIAPDIFALVFGEAWRAAGNYAQLLMPYMFLSFISLPLNALPIAFDKQRGELFFQTGMAIARCVAILVGSAMGGIELTMALLSLVGGTGWLLYLLWAMSLVNHGPGQVLRDLAREVMFSIPCILPVSLAKVLVDTGAPGWLIAIAAVCWLASLAVVAVRAMPALGMANVLFAGSITRSI
jgi:O-antigen/teichoic acid export membrane protein